jgi:hypothetical protein
MSERVYKQLQNAVPNADTPAQTATLRAALAMLVADTDYDISEEERDWVRGWLDMAAWSETTRHVLIILALRWAQGKPWVESLRKSLGVRKPGELQPPQAHYPSGKEPDMATIPQSQEVTLMALTTEDEQRLARVLASMETDPYWFPEDRNRLATAATIYRDGRVRCDTAGMYHVTGSGSPKTAKIYQIDKECSCEFARKNQRTKWCQHLIATVIYRKMLAPFRNDAEPALFAAPKTVDQRYAESPEEVLGFSQDAPEDEWPEDEAILAPSEPPEDTITPQDGEGDTPVPEALVEAPSAPPPLSEESIKTYRQTIMRQLKVLGMQPKSREAAEDAIMSLVGLVLAPENFPLITERLSEIITTRTREAPAAIPEEYYTTIHGNKYVKYAGLLALAHDHGLMELKAEFVSVTADLALASAYAVFQDGHKFWDAADATPTNVKDAVKAHFPRMALTRAKARCLRDALNITDPSAEEME